MVAVFMALIMTKRMSALVALIVVPIAFGLLAGFGRDLGPMMLQGITKLAPTGVMLMFAILYFGIMIDAGLFEPFVRRLVRVVHGDPVKVVVGTAVLAFLVSLDGDGSTTYMITTAAMLPLYLRLRISPLVLTCVTMLASGIMNILPWGGPTARAASALQIDVAQLFVPLIPAMIGGAACVLVLAWRLGLRERRRLAASPLSEAESASNGAQLGLADLPPKGSRPRLIAVNAILTIVLLAALVTNLLPLAALFMIAFAIAAMINYPSVAEQKEHITAHAGNALSVGGLIFAAGIFTGILSGTKMVDAMAASVVTTIPTSLAPYLAPVTGLLSIPFTFFISNDAFYFGVVPILAKAGAAYGIAAAEIGRAALVGQPVHLLSPLVPSTYLLVGLANAELGDHQRYTLKWTLVASLAMLAVGLATGVIPLIGRIVPR
jgi:CitMHS family citrate-Mg2+:H+ or citrate-Ca2+:H+ symporter